MTTEFRYATFGDLVLALEGVGLARAEAVQYPNDVGVAIPDLVRRDRFGSIGWDARRGVAKAVVRLGDGENLTVFEAAPRCYKAPWIESKQQAIGVALALARIAIG